MEGGESINLECVSMTRLEGTNWPTFLSPHLLKCPLQLTVVMLLQYLRDTYLVGVCTKLG